MNSWADHTNIECVQQFDRNWALPGGKRRAAGELLEAEYEASFKAEASLREPFVILLGVQGARANPRLENTQIVRLFLAGSFSCDHGD